MITKFDNNIKTDSILYFNAEWCSPCKALKPILEGLVKEVVSIDIEEHPDIANYYAVMSLPTVIVLKDNAEIKRITGYNGPDNYKGL